MSEVTLQPAKGKSILFIVPAFQRVELAAICYRQFGEMIDALDERYGLDAEVLVLSDDENLDAASASGLATCEVKNWLGQRLNTGYRFAHENGYDYVCALGNDSFMIPDRFQWLPVGDAILCTRNYTCVNPDGTEQVALTLNYPGGVGSRVFPTDMFKRVDWAPMDDPAQMSGCDTATLTALCRNVERAPDLIYTDIHPAGVVGFQSPDVQVTKWAWFLQYPHRVEEPFHGLADVYGDDLVDAVRAHYAAVAA